MILRLDPSALFLRVTYYVIASLYYSNFWKNQKYSSKSPEIQFFLCKFVQHFKTKLKIT